MHKDRQEPEDKQTGKGGSAKGKIGDKDHTRDKEKDGKGSSKEGDRGKGSKERGETRHNRNTLGKQSASREHTLRNRELRQAAIILDDNRISTHIDNNKRVGGNFNKKQEGTIKVIAQNVGRIPTRANMTKLHKLMKFMVESNADVFGFSKIGLN